MSQKKTRVESRVECSLVQLAADIDFVYKDLKDNLQFSISHLRLAEIKYKILSDLYILSPLQVKFIEKGDLPVFLKDTLPDCPDIMLGTCVNEKEVVCVVMPNNKEDVL